MEVIFGFSFVYVQIFVNLQSHNQHIYILYPSTDGIDRQNHITTIWKIQTSRA